jgi:hypothetical protein
VRRRPAARSMLDLAASGLGPAGASEPQAARERAAVTTNVAAALRVGRDLMPRRYAAGDPNEITETLTLRPWG